MTMSKILAWKAEVTPGNIVSWGMTLIAAVVVVVWLQADVRDLTKSQERLLDRVLKLEAADLVFNARLAAITEQASSRQEVIVTRLTRIETILERVEKNSSNSPRP